MTAPSVYPNSTATITDTHGVDQQVITLQGIEQLVQGIHDEIQGIHTELKKQSVMMAQMDERISTIYHRNSGKPYRGD